MANALLIPPLPIAAITASATSVGAAAYLGNDYGGMIWRAPNGDEQTLIVDLGSDMVFDTAMLFGLLSDRLLTTAFVDVWLATAAQGTGFNGSSVTTGTGTGNFWAAPRQTLAAGSVLPVGGRGTGLVTWSAGPPAANRYVLIHFGGLTASGYIAASRIVLGKRVQLARNFSYGAGLGVKDLGALDFSRRGVLLRTRGAKLRAVQLSFSNIYRDEVEASTRPLLETVGNTEPVALVLDPAANADRMNRCYFGPLAGDLGHVWRNARAWEAKVNMVSLF